MEKRHRCKLCFRSFGNGRALGGHMRSHAIKFYDDHRRPKLFNQDDHREFDFRSFSSTSVSSSDEEEIEQQVKAANALMEDHVVNDNDSYAESKTEEEEQQRIRTVSKRSKRIPRRFIHQYPSSNKRPNTSHDHDNSSLSSISDTTPEEQVAHSLIMLSRDNWGRAEMEFEGDSKPKPKLVGGLRRGSSISSSKYRCEECNKLFKSYQALGGHRASHKKTRAHAPPAAKLQEKVHKCPFCQKVFPSGQALGGHKRSHFIGMGSSPAQNSTKCEALIIDLNLPAPVEQEEEEEEEISQVEVSDIC